MRFRDNIAPQIAFYFVTLLLFHWNSEFAFAQNSRNDQMLGLHYDWTLKIDEPYRSTLAAKIPNQSVSQRLVTDNSYLHLNMKRQLLLQPEKVQQGHRKKREGKKQRRTHREAISSSSSPCSLVSENPDLPAMLKALSKEGNILLIEYKLTFPEYSFNPLETDSIMPSLDNRSIVYKSSSWQRVMSRQGKVLLSLAFDYDVLSLGLLSHNVKKITVGLLDNPPKCFAGQNSYQKLTLAMKLLLRDFSDGNGERSEEDSDRWDNHENDPVEDWTDYVCHQIVRNNSGFAKFSHFCCTRNKLSNWKTSCFNSDQDKIISVLNVLLVFLKIVFFFFGPLFLHKLLFSGSTGKSEYVVPLERHLRKTILIRRVLCEESSTSERKKEMSQFVEFRELIKDLKSEEVISVKFKRFDIVVDNRELMSEDEVPVGFLRFLIDTFIRCRISRVEPFRTCCAESVVGSWSPYFLWIRLKRHASDCNRGCKEICAWSSLFKCLGALLLMAIIPLPYYIRLTIFYWSEKEEVQDRENMRNLLGLGYRPDNNLFQWMTPGHSFIISVHVLFLLSYVLLFALRSGNRQKVDDFILRSATDMRKIRRRECLRMLCAHLVLPFEKFGLCGVFVAAFYWPLVVPLCLLVALVYCVPTLYLVGRLLIPSRMQCLRTQPIAATTGLHINRSLSEGVSSFSSCFMLNQISVEREEIPQISAGNGDKRGSPSRLLRFCPSHENVVRIAAAAVLAISVIVCMLTVLAMYSEAFGFLVEMGVFITLGALANAHHSITYVILLFWASIQVSFPYWLVYGEYVELSHSIFEYIKSRLLENIETASFLRQEKRMNTAFKFTEIKSPTVTQLSTSKQNESCFFSEEDAELQAPAEDEVHSLRRKNGDLNTLPQDESIEYRGNRLHWKICSLVMFVDKKDKPRIPRELFWRICELDLPGNPGPVRNSMAKATGQALASLVYLLLLYIVVSLSVEMQKSSTSIQAFCVLALGSVPLVFLFCGKYLRVNPPLLNDYSLNGKIQTAILNYEHAWPVQDLHFTRNSPKARERKAKSSDSELSTTPGIFDRSASRGRASYDPSQVDLLITIRDETQYKEASKDSLCRSPSPPESSRLVINRIQKETVDPSRQGVPLRNLGNRAARCASDPFSSGFGSSHLTYDAFERQETSNKYPRASYDNTVPLHITTQDVLVTLEN